MKTKLSRSFNWLVLFCFYFQTLWPTVVFATDVEVMRPASPSRFFYAPSAPEYMYLDLRISIDDKNKPFQEEQKKPSLKIPYVDSVDEAQSLIDASFEIQSIYPGLQVSEKGLYWNAYGFSFSINSDGHLHVTEQKGAQTRSSALRLFNPHGTITIAETVNLLDLRAKSPQVLLQGCHGKVETLSFWATGDDGKVGIDETSSILIKRLIVHEGTLHNFGTLTIDDHGLLDSGAKSIANYGSIHLEDQSTLRAKEVHNKRAQKDATSAPTVGTITGNGSVSLQVETLKNLGVVQIATIQGFINKLINPGHFEATKGFQRLAVHELLNEGRFKGNGQLSLSGINEGIFESDELICTLLDDFANQGLITVRTKLTTEGKGAFIQEGRLELPYAYFNNSQFINKTSIDLSLASWVFGKALEKWQNEEGAEIAVQDLTFDSPFIDSQVSLNEGVISAKRFINRRNFKNMGSLRLGQWHQEGRSFINGSDGEIDVGEEATFDVDQVENEGSITLKGQSKGRIGITKNIGTWLFKGASKLTGQQLLIGAKATFRADDVFDWMGELVNNEGKLFLFDNQIQATQQVINHNLIRWAHNSFRSMHILNLGWMERSDQFDAPLPTFTVAADKTTTFKKRTIENRGVIKMSPTTYSSLMTLKGAKFRQWINTGSMELGGQNFASQSFHNTGELVFHGPVIGRIDHFESTGQLFAHSTFKITGQTFIASDKAFVESHSSFDLTTVDPLHMRGNWKVHQGFSVTAPSIETFGTIVNEHGRTQLNTSSLANRGGKVHIATLAYEGTDITNEQGQIQIGKLDRKEPAALKIINKRAIDEATRDETRKTKVHILGGARLEIINTALMILAGGKYEITDIDNTNGRLEGDSVTFDGHTASDLSLAGILVINKLYGTNRLKTVTIKGRTTFITGGLKAQKVHILLSSQLSLGMGESDFDEILNHGILKALSSMKVTTRKLSNKGSIESDTSLKIQGLHQYDSYEKDTSATPTIKVELKNWSSLAADLVLGLLKAKKDIHFHLSFSLDLADFLYKYGENWQCEGILYLKTTGDFKPKSNMELGRRVHLEVASYENDKHNLAFQSLKLIADKFRHGKSNNEMAMLETRASGYPYLGYGHALEIIVTGDIDLQYGQTHSVGPTMLISTSGNVLIGAPKLIPSQPICSTYTTGTGTVYGYYDFKEKNGAFVESKDRLHIEGGYIKGDYGDIHASRKATFKGRNGISSESGQIFLQQGGTVETPEFLLTCAPAIGHDFSGAVGHSGCIHSGFPSHGARFLSLGDVTFKTTSNIVRSSDFLSLGNVYVNGMLSNEAEYFSLETASGIAGCSPYCGCRSGYGYKYAAAPQFMGGKHVSVTAKRHNSAGGFLFGETIELSGETYNLSYLGKALQAFAQGYVVSVLNTVRSFIAPGGRGVIQETSAGIARRFPDRHARVLDEAHIAFMGSQKLGIPIGLSPYIASELNPWALEMMIAENLRVLSIPGEAGDIFQTMTTRGKQAALSGALMSPQDLNHHDKSFVFFDMEEVRPGAKAPILQLYIALEEKRRLFVTLQGLVGGKVKADFRGKAQLTGGAVYALNEEDTADDPALQFKAAEIEASVAKYNQAVAVPGGTRIDEVLASQPTFGSHAHGLVSATERDFRTTGAQFNLAKGGAIGSEQGATLILDDTLVSQTRTKQKKREHYEQTITSVPTRIGKSTAPIVFFAGNGQPVVLGYTQSEAAKIIVWTPNGPVQMLQGRHHHVSSTTSKSSNALWQRLSKRDEEHLTYLQSSFAGPVEIYSRETMLEQVRGQTLSFLSQIEQHGGPITYSILDEVHNIQSFRASGPTAGFAALISLAISIATYGTGSSIGATFATKTLGLAASGTASAFVAGATSAAFTSVCAQGAIAMINHNGDVGKALKDLTSSDALKSIATSAMSAGLMNGFGAHFGIPTTAAECTKPIHHVQRYALQAGIDVGLNMTMGADFEEAAVRAGRLAAASTIGGIASNHIGAAGFDFVTHKMLHAAAGALGGLIASGDALAGATGAVSAEILAEIIQENPKMTTKRVVDKVKAEGKPVNERELRSLVQAELRKTTDVARLGAAVTTLLTKQDVSVGIATGTIAVENNFALSLGAKLTSAVIAELGILALNVTAGLLAKQQIEEALQENAMDAAPEDARWIDGGVDTEEGKPTVLATPDTVDIGATDRGYETAPDDFLRGLQEGFGIYDGPDASVLEKEYDYSQKYQKNKASFGEPAREFSGKLSKPLRVFSYHNGTDLAAEKRSVIWWAPIGEGNKLHTVEAVQDHLALLTQWGERTHVSVAEIPAGVNVKFLYGRSEPFSSEKTGEVRPGGGVQYAFEKFNSDWIKDTQPLPK